MKSGTVIRLRGTSDLWSGLAIADFFEIVLWVDMGASSVLPGPGKPPASARPYPAAAPRKSADFAAIRPA